MVEAKVLDRHWLTVRRGWAGECARSARWFLRAATDSMSNSDLRGDAVRAFFVEVQLAVKWAWLSKGVSR